MPTTLELCEKYFGSNDIYKLLNITKDSPEKEIKKAYYRLSLKVHPDRVSDDEKELATEKFKVLAKIHEVLNDKNRKALYDDKGIIDDDDEEGKLSTWLELWRKIFKPITDEDIDSFEKEYVGSELEKSDIKKSYLNGKGCINYLMNCVPFMKVEDEPRIAKIIQEMIDSKEVPEYTIFTNEPAAKRNRRHKKYAREQKESREIKEKLQKQNAGSGSLEQQILKRQTERSTNFDTYFDHLLEKYGNDDGSEAFDFSKLNKNKSKKKKSTSAKNDNAGGGARDRKSRDRKVKNGRVTKN